MVREFTIPRLEKLLKQRKDKLGRLMRQRQRLKERLIHLDRQIAEIGGKRQVVRRYRRRPKNAKTLLAVVIETLAKHSKGLTLAELAKQVLEGGYKTSSSKFQNTLYQMLYQNTDKIGHDTKTHTYRLKNQRESP